MHKVHETLEALVSPHPVVSAWTIIRAMNPPLPQNLNDRLNETLASLRSSLIAADGDQALLQIMLPDNGTPYTRTLAGAVQDTLAQLHQPYFLSGILLVSAEISTKVIRQLNWSIFATGIFSAFLLAITFRRASYVTYALLPNILPIILVGALLFLTDQGLKFSGALAMTIALGIAVDDTIHLLSRMKLHERDDAVGVPILAALTDVGPVLISTSVVMVLGIAVTGFSQMPSIANFGFLSGLVIVLALIADLTILPAIIFSFKRSRSFRKNTRMP